MQINTAEYIASYTTVEKCPAKQVPEFAFIGRSNVGKSSLINFICGRKKLSKVSVTPGKTQLLNFFLINGHFHLVDLPGYGFAKISREQRNKWMTMIKGYLANREQLLYVLLLIDSRIPPQKLDLDFANWLGENHVPFVLVFTKADKPGSAEIQGNMQAFKDKMLEHWAELPPSFVTSAEYNKGREEVHQWMAGEIALYKPAPAK